MAEPVAVESRIEQVTVYARGARVRRVATVRAPVPEIVRIADLPLGALDDSVRVEVDGGATVTAVRAREEVPAAAPAAEETAELAAAKARVANADAEIERIDGAIERLAAAPVVVADETDEPPAAWSQVMTARRGLVELRVTREQALREQLAAARRELAEANRALEVAVEHDARTGTARAAKLHELRKQISLDVTPSGGDAVIRIEYLVEAARWAPSYVARLDGDAAKLELRAIVAQQTGEDWTGVPLELSTAEPARFAELPELAPQKIGRRQTPPGKRGFRAPPAGAGELYADYARAFRARTPRPFTADSVRDDSTYDGVVPSAHAELDLLRSESWDDDDTGAGMPPPAPPMGMASPMVMTQGAVRSPIPDMARSAPMKKRGGLGGVLAGPAAVAKTLMQAPGGGGRAREEQAKDDAFEPGPPVPRLDYGSLRMVGASASQRGQLLPAATAYAYTRSPRVTDGVAAIAHLALPRGYEAEWAHAYDYAYASDGALDVKSDGAWHSLAIATRATKAKLRHVAVPREQADVFRLAELANPFDGPLLPGPIDVYDRGQFLVTSEAELTPPAATVEIGLGVDASVKIARNATFHEEAAGMLRGALKLVHAIAIEVENLSPRAIDVEVRERVPVAREGDDAVEVSIGKVEPAWEKWAPDPDAPDDARLRGGHRWRVQVAAGAKKQLRAAYEVKIASKLELVGGNRRES